MEEKIIQTIQDLVTALVEDYENYDGAVWFRGHANSGWELKPSYLRLSNPPSEATLLKRFKQNASLLLEKEPNGSFDWLFLMQHHGVPTRLLDWSESPLVALYFALETYESHDGEDAALWSLLPTEFNKNANIADPNESFFIPSFEEDELVTYSVENLSSGPKLALFPVATIATRNNARLQSQLGVFTIHHLQPIAIESVGDGEHVKKYIIPSANKEAMLKQLRLLGFSKFTMFPELASVGENIKRDLK